MLNFNKAWRFDSPGAAPDGLVDSFGGLIARLAAQGGGKPIYEHYKRAFAQAAGREISQSSDTRYAIQDLRQVMSEAAANAPIFIEAFYDAGLALQRNNPDLGLPPLDHVNRILAEHRAGFQIQPPDLIVTSGFVETVVVPPPPSLSEQAAVIIQQSYEKSAGFLDRQDWRPAVQEILWLLESVTTAFQGLQVAQVTVTGKYFNEIIKDLRAAHRDRTLDQVLGWVKTLHGYLSSPTGGGVRHGAVLRPELNITASEARLYCNLGRSYVSFLTEEHGRISSARP